MELDTNLNMIQVVEKKQQKYEACYNDCSKATCE